MNRLKVKVLNRHIIKDPSDSSKNQSDIYLTPYEELYQLTEQFIIWFRTAPYRKGLEERLRAFHAVIHQVVKSDNVLVPVPIPHLKPQVYILELDMLDDGEIYDIELNNKQLRILKVKYEDELITKTDYDNQVVNSEELDIQLRSAIDRYNTLKEQIQKPWIAFSK